MTSPKYNPISQKLFGNKFIDYAKSEKMRYRKSRHLALNLDSKRGRGGWDRKPVCFTFPPIPLFYLKPNQMNSLSKEHTELSGQNSVYKTAHLR